MDIKGFVMELEIYAKTLEAQGNYVLAAKIEMLLIRLNEMIKENHYVS
jgi:hypothetical protein